MTVFEQDGVTLLIGDVLDVLAKMEPESVDCVVTSPPYWSLRQYSGEQDRIWGGEPEHAHEWGSVSKNGAAVEGYTGKRKWQHGTNGRGEDHPEARSRRDNPDDWTRITVSTNLCECGAWRGQYGLEPTPELYVEHSILILQAIRRVLKPQGTVWWNIGDSYSGSRKGSMADGSYTGGDKQRTNAGSLSGQSTASRRRDDAQIPRSDHAVGGLKPKDLVLIPWRVGLAAQADGWWVRSDIIWHKPNPMPESVTDRPTKAHEYVLLLSKSERYYYDQDSVRETFAPATIERITQETLNDQQGGFKQEQYEQGFPGKKHRDRRPAEIIKAMGATRKQTERAEELFAAAGLTDEHRAAIRAVGVTDVGKSRVTQSGTGKNDPAVQALADEAKAALGGYYREFTFGTAGRNMRTVWTIPTQPSPLPHFAAFPDELAERCIKAGCPPDGTVLDPFFGTGTTGIVARQLGRKCIGIEISDDYAQLAKKRLSVGVRGVQAIERGQAQML